MSKSAAKSEIDHQFLFKIFPGYFEYGTPILSQKK